MAGLTLAFCLPASAQGERTIVTPAGATLAPLEGSVEGLFGVDHGTRRSTWVNGAVDLYEFEGAHLQTSNRDTTAVSVQALVLPETFVTPSISVGVRDILNSTHSYTDFGYGGRSIYFTAGKTLLSTELSPYPFRNASISAGLGTNVRAGFFGGLSADMGFGFRQSIEFDGRALNYRVAHDFGGVARLEYVRLHGKNFIGAEFNTPIRM